MVRYCGKATIFGDTHVELANDCVEPCEESSGVVPVAEPVKQHQETVYGSTHGISECLGAPSQQ